MNPLELIEKLVNEHGSAAILREHLELLRAKHAELERARAQADAKAQQLQTQLDETQARLKQAQAQLAALQGGLMASHVCASCASARLVRCGTRAHPVFGQVGLREAILRCEDCQAITYLELPLP